jgi:hypothetical protein
MNSKLWIRKIVATLLIASFSFLMAACPQEKVNETIRDFKDNSAKAKIYANKIRSANRASYDAGDLSLQQFKTLTAATKKFRDAIKVLDEGIEQAKIVLRDNPDGKRSALDMLDRILTDQVVKAFDDMVAVITNQHVVTPEVEGWINTIRIALAAIRALFGDAGNLIDGGAYAAA